MPMPHHTHHYAAIHQLVLATLAEGQCIESRRRMARFLCAIAEELERPRTGGPAPGGLPGAGLHWNGVDLVIGRTLWRGIGEARRVSFEFAGSVTHIRPDPDGDHDPLPISPEPRGAVVPTFAIRHRCTSLTATCAARRYS
jgi:hypothetical protein